jgi:phosphoglycolate phosphatase-like HAD superfamily hydrolase
MVGDSTCDLLAARRSGLRSILVRTGEGGRDGRCPEEPDFMADDLSAAVALILEQRAPSQAESLTPALETAS